MKRIRLMSITFAVMALAAGIAAASASASPTFSNTFSFGSYGFGETQFGVPYGIDTDSQGNVWIAAWMPLPPGSDRVMEFSSTGKYLATITGSGEHKVTEVKDVAVAPNGNIWVSVYGPGKVLEFKPNGEFVREILPGFSAGGENIAIDSKGNLWIDDVSNHIDKVSPEGKLLTSITVPYGGFEVDASDNLLVANTTEKSIDKYSSAGSYLGTAIGKGTFSSPDLVTVDTGGNIWVEDGSTVKGYTAKGEYLTQFTETQPTRSMTAAAEGSLWLGVSSNGNQIQKWSPAPDTTITGGSAGKVTPDVTFMFSSNEGGSTFECALDAGAYAACSSPKTYEVLAEGSHTFKVRAVKGGVADPTPAERTVEVKEVAKAVSSIAVLDEFARSENPLANGKWTKTSWAEEIGASWLSPWHGYGANGSHLASAYWNGASFSDATAGLLVSATVGTGSTAAGEYMSLWLNMPSPGSQRSGYEARFTGTNGSSSGYKVELSRWISGARTVLGSKENVSLPVGTTFVLTETGSKLNVWAGTSSFSRVISAGMTNYYSGYAGIEVYKGAGTAYNFRAGNVK